MGLLQKLPTEFSFLFYILIFNYFFRYESIVRSSAWPFGHSDPDPSSVSVHGTFSLNLRPVLKFSEKNVII